MSATSCKKITARCNLLEHPQRPSIAALVDPNSMPALRLRRQSSAVLMCWSSNFDVRGATAHTLSDAVCGIDLQTFCCDDTCFKLAFSFCSVCALAAYIASFIEKLTLENSLRNALTCRMS